MPDLVSASPASPPSLHPSPGRLWVITGPSGVGKGTLLKALRERHPELYFSVSVTTRPARSGEQDGVNYFFRSREEFMRLEAEGGLLEWAEYANHLYGTPAAAVYSKRQSGIDVVLEIELNGARQVAARCPEAIRIFIQPPLHGRTRTPPAGTRPRQRSQHPKAPPPSRNRDLRRPRV